MRNSLEAIAARCDVKPETPNMKTSGIEAQSNSTYSCLEADQFRIVRIHQGSPQSEIRCTLETVSFTKSPSYVALSYVWGSTLNPRQIWLNGNPHLITQNLNAALLNLRFEDCDRLIWIDALAINQSNVSERNAQVSRMCDIYALSSSLIIWLGARLDLSKLRCDAELHKGACAKAVFVLQTMQRYSPSRIEDFREAVMSLTETEAWNWLFGLVVIADMTYWRRAWVFQEIMFGLDASIHFQSAIVDFSTFTSLYDVALVHLEKRTSLFATSWRAAGNIATVRDGGTRYAPAPVLVAKGTSWTGQHSSK